MTHSKVYQVLVVGGGLNGLSTLYQLQRLGCRKLALVEQFDVGHIRGSSHGASRITRSAYHDADYVRLMQLCHAESWPQLERDAAQQLIWPSPCCVFGPKHGIFAQYAQAVLAGGADVEAIDVATARQRYPMFRFADDDGILDDHTAGIVAASDTIQALFRLCQRDDTDYFGQTRVLDIAPQGDLFCITTSQGELHAERVVVTAGAWITRLLPFLQARTYVTRQTVLHVEMEGDPADYAWGAFPIWAYLQAAGENPLHYGLPTFRSTGLKIARHITEGREDDPDQEIAAGEPAMVDYLLDFLKRRLHPTVARVAATETCLYTNTPNEDFILDLHPDHPRIAIGAGFSGHGFKFGPLTGRILAELVLHGRTSLPEFQSIRQRFSIDRGGRHSPSK